MCECMDFADECIYISVYIIYIYILPYIYMNIQIHL